MADNRTESGAGPSKYWGPVWALIVAAAILAGFLRVAVWLIGELRQQGSARFEFAFPILLILTGGGLIVLIGCLVPIYRRAGMASKNEALGLPKGSVRALIALLFLVMFLMTAVFLQNQVESELRTLQGLTLEQRDSLLKESPTSGMTVVAMRETSPKEQGGKPTWEVDVRINPSPDTVRFADRMFVTLSTIITALVAFYFGERSVSAARSTRNDDDGEAPGGGGDENAPEQPPSGATPAAAVVEPS